MAESSIKATLWNIYFIYSFEIYTLASTCWCLILSWMPPLLLWYVYIMYVYIMPPLLLWYVYISSTSGSMCVTDPPGVATTDTVFICTQRRELCHSDVEGLMQGCQSKGSMDGVERIREEEHLGAAIWVPVCGQKWQTGRRGLTRKQSSKSRGLQAGMKP